MTPPLLVCHLLFLSEYLDDPIANPFDSISPSNSNRSRKLQTVRFVSMAVSLGVQGQQKTWCEQIQHNHL
jgi:hypothetical protein